MLERDVLYSEYWENNLSITEIGKKYGIPKPTVICWFNKLAIPKRTQSECCKLRAKKYPTKFSQQEKHKIIVKCAWCGNPKEVWPYVYRSVEHHYCSKRCKAKHWGEIYQGENAHNWKGGQWKSNSDMREWSRYQVVRNEVRERDNWTCQLCGCRSNIIAHHIIPVRTSVTLIFEPTNLISLCQKCHIEKVNFHEEEFVKLFTDIVAKTVNCWDSLKPLCHNMAGNGECEGSKS